MDKIFFITDLDRTIIHSKHIGYKCVEKLGDREITYMTDYAYEKLHELLKREEFIFIPCTMRNINQTLRVDFIRSYNPKIIICTNGAQIYIDGKLDEVWDKQMKALCDKDELNKNIRYLENLKEEYKELIGIIEVRNIEDFYITVKCVDSHEADKFYNIISNSFDKSINVLKIEAKIFIIHNRINKVYAVDYIIEKFNIKKLITSGDTDVDKEFTSRGIAILPKHSSFKHEKAIITERNKIHATEEILDYIEEIIE
ncbi:HAD family hydrolase [uncultured Clostridium sp.]|uniref:HAD family hydrolase n=1 Tax=uncultured Clostridium sp. TaxID=59620 RepID=UPI0025D5BFC4|nr:HAD family hydrolase [uncultured Clostridium sp.]MDU4883148.1 haloacid dehalogenase [Clostridium celatum]MDU7076277.1 haloacid dehalogenase [Clostridium celatum]